MQAALSASWVGQTVALPRCSSSPGKKTRNRRSKEERKTMVESFIKKYQGANSGSFPSLNLTHKEVGGSFYTVRQLVREIIQENKVLRPGNPNSPVLTLKNGAEPLSFEWGDHFSLETNGHSIEDIERKAAPISSQDQIHNHMDNMITTEGYTESDIHLNSYYFKDLQAVDHDILEVHKDVANKVQQENYEFLGDEEINEKYQSDGMEELLNHSSQPKEKLGLFLGQTSQEKEDPIIFLEAPKSNELLMENKEDTFKSLKHIKPKEVPLEKYYFEDTHVSKDVSSGHSNNEPIQPTTPGLDILHSSPTESAREKRETVLENDTSMDRVDSTTETSSCLSHAYETESKSKVVSESNHSPSNSVISSEKSKDASEDQESHKTNSVISVIKGVVAAVVKFFTG